MPDIESAVNSQGRYVGQELIRLGWQRKRIWSAGGSYSRYRGHPPESLILQFYLFRHRRTEELGNRAEANEFCPLLPRRRVHG